MNLNSEDALRVSALVPPLAVRLYEDGTDMAAQRLMMLALAVGVSWGWAALFARRAERRPGPGILPYAATFALLPPAPVAWGLAILAFSFGAVFGREVFGGKAVLPPAVVGLAFAVFSFPDGGFELQGVLGAAPDPLFALSCLPGAAVMVWKNILSWRIVAGAVVGIAAAAGLAADAPDWWLQPGLGAFAFGAVFLVAAPEGAPRHRSAQWLHGVLAGALVVLFRFANPEQPDGIAFAALLAALFAPLLDRAAGWRAHHG